VLNLLFAPQNLPFAIAFALLLLIVLVELLGLLLATSPSSLIDNLLPEDFGEGALDRLLGWLHLGKVPSLVLLVLFLLGFALAGYALQFCMQSLFGLPLPTVLAALIVLPVGLFSVRSFGAVLARLIPQDESTVVSEKSLLGLIGTVSQGEARQGLAAQARVRDKNGHTHYLLVEPDVATERFAEGTQILLVSKSGAIWRCIRNPHPELL